MHSNSRHKTRSAPVGAVEQGIALCHTRNRRGFAFQPDTGPHKAKAVGAQSRLISEYSERIRISGLFLKVAGHE